MSKVINILQPAIFNLLAAGEVVENPASVVKECVENSLDAGASVIEIAIVRGGFDEIRITDNGSGVAAGEVEKVFLPHATSKISVESDLDAIKTFGFRGEAMSSIARVSKAAIVTKVADVQTATQLDLDGGEIVTRGEVAANVGTTITIRNLFYNTPARKKFLGSVGVERNNVTTIVQKFIMANPHVSFRYLIDGEVFYDYNGGELIDAVELIYGAETAKSVIKVSAESPEYRIDGYVSAPGFSKRNRTYQTVMVNSRTIHGGTVAEAAGEAMSQYMGVGEFPFFVLNFGIDERSLDVNIHPRKLQVKFENVEIIKDFIARSISTAIDEHLYQKTKQVDMILPSPNIATVQRAAKFYDETATSENKKEIEGAPNTMDNLARSFYVEEPPATQELIYHEPPPFKLLGTMYGTYIMLQHDDKLFIIDQHAAAERLLYDKLKDEVDRGAVLTQPLVPPIVLHLNPTELNQVIPMLFALEKIGIRAEEFGNDCIRILSVPVAISTHSAVEDVIKGMLGEVKKLKLSQLLAPKLIEIACKNSLRGSRTLTEDQITLFLEMFKDKGIPPLCPHGRPVMAILGKPEFDKMFKR